jgi:integrase/recombinase XerD
MTALGDAAVEYLALRRALGFKLEVPGRLLPDFVAFADGRNATTITVALAMDWAATASSPSMVGRRLQALRGFARWFRCLDPTSQVPPGGLVSTKGHRQQPYLFSSSEVAALMGAARQLRPALGAATTETVIGLLAATGMRIGEVLRLDDSDVDYRDGTLTVWQTKFGKSRLLVLSASTLDALRDYQQLRRRLAPAATSAALLVSPAGGRLGYNQFHAAFVNLLATTGIPTRSQPRRPRIHDLRHSFTVATVLDWYRQGLDVAVMLPRLSTYLGHVDPASTYWYLSATPELLALAADRLEGRDHNGAAS